MYYRIKNIVPGRTEGEESRFLTVGDMRSADEGPGFIVKLYLSPYEIRAMVDDRHPGRYHLVRAKTDAERAYMPDSYDTIILGNMFPTRSGNGFMLRLNMYNNLSLLASPDDPAARTARGASHPAPDEPPAPHPSSSEYDGIPF